MKWLIAYGVALLFGLVLPILVVVVGSVTAGEMIEFPPAGFSWRWYTAFFESAEFMASTWTSLQVAGATCVIAGVLGTLSALAIARQRFRGEAIVEGILMAPLGIPSVAMGLAFLIYYTEIGIAGSKLGLIAAHTVITLPFVLRLVRANFAGYSWTVERAAANLGADAWKVFWHVTFPLVLPGILGGMIFAFVVSFDEVVTSIFLSGPDATTLPVRIFTYLDQSPGPIVLAAGSILVVFAVVFMVLLELTVKVGRAFGVDDA